MPPDEVGLLLLMREARSRAHGEVADRILPLLSKSRYKDLRSTRSRCASPLFRRNASDRCGERSVGGGIDGLVLDERACGDGTEVVVVFPVYGRSNGSRRKSSATVRADVAQHGINAVRAKRALETADTSVGGGGRKSAIAVFARGAKREGFNDVKFLVGQPVFAANFFFGRRHGVEFSLRSFRPSTTFSQSTKSRLW